MGIIRPLIIGILLYILALLQGSFLPHFSIAGQVPNIVFIFFFLLVFFDEEYLFIYAAIAAFLMDISFFPFIGPSFIALYAVWGFQKSLTHFFEKSYERHQVIALSFILSYAANFIVYTMVIMLLSWIFGFSFSIGWDFFIGLAYNCVFAFIGFVAFKQFGKRQDQNQLRLF